MPMIFSYQVQGSLLTGNKSIPSNFAGKSLSEHLWQQELFRERKYGHPEAKFRKYLMLS